jgi:hypothetical protein
VVQAGELKDLVHDGWSEATLPFREPRAATADVLVDEVRFLLPRPSGCPARLLVDDVLLYEPGESSR